AHAYSQDDARLLAAIAEEIAVSLDNTLSHEQLREGHERLSLLLELTNSLVSNLELRDVLKTVMGSARRVMRSDSAVVALPDADGVGFHTQVANQLAIAVENALAYGEIRSLKDKLAEERVYLRDEVRNERNFEEVVGKSKVLRRVLRNAETVAPTDSTVLIYG